MPSFDFQQRRPQRSASPIQKAKLPQAARPPLADAQQTARPSQASGGIPPNQRGFSLKHIPISPPEAAQVPSQKGGKTALPAPLKSSMEALSGLRMDDVRVHYNSSRPIQLQAAAYTQGSEIYMGPGQEKHLAHEAWHIVQQRQGRVRPTLQARGMAINDDEGLEREADAMAERASRSAASWAPPLPDSGFDPSPSRSDQSGPGVIQAKRYRWTSGVWKPIPRSAKRGEYKLPASGNEGDEFDDVTGEHTDKDGAPTSAPRSHSGKKRRGVKEESEGEESENEEEEDEEEGEKEQQPARRTRGVAAKEKAAKKEKRRKKQADPVWKKLAPRQRTLVTQAETIRIVLGGNKVPEDDINKIFKPVDDAREEFKNVIDADQRGDMTVAENKYIDAVKEAIGTAWSNHNDILPTDLQPTGEIFKERAYTGTVQDAERRAGQYFTGKTADQAIPIVWYKPPAEYPKIRADRRTFEMKDGTEVKLGSKTLKPVEENIPPANPGRDAKAFILRKVAHHETREGQKELNDLLNEHAEVHNGKKWVKQPMGEKGGFDGDHIKDLGFGGSDNAANYWPLAAKINRRAYTGYNSQYIVNYKTDKGHLAAKPVGGLIGKYFKVKGYIENDSSVPEESGKAYAGTWETK